MLKAAVFQPQAHAQAAQAVAERTEAQPRAADGARKAPPAQLAPSHLYRAVTGTIIDISPHVVTIGDAAGERRYALTSDAVGWRGATLEPSALTPGNEAVLRLLPGRSEVADRIWADIGRVTGIIVSVDGDTITVAEGTMKRTQNVIVPAYASGRIEVRFPNLQPGYLIDLIGIRRKDHLEATFPATSQPPYHSDLVPAQHPEGGRVPDAIAGSAIWHDASDEPYGVLGVCYPAIDPAAGCAEDAAAGFPPGQAPAYRDLPYLAVGTALTVHNECSGVSWTLPVTGCAPMARPFNDHCVTCRRSPRGRVADLTLASFVALGGELQTGCFYATLSIGR
ncbi:MAG TPA: hypothetical protein VLX31_04570 [Streptosporangiaceae bacterium]|nr:hypothetical protein [Streptosporangiaceae bacterium]